MAKYGIILALAAVGYFVFIYDPYPSTVFFQGIELGNKTDQNNSLHDDIDIFTYRDKTNHHILMLALPKNSPTVTIDGLTELYLGRLESQGIKFKQMGRRYTGRRDNTFLYMARANLIDAVIIYTEAKTANAPASDKEAIFTELENFSF